MQFYLLAKVLAGKGRYRPNNILYANSNGYAIHNNKGDQVSSIAASWAIYHHMIMGPPEGSILIAQMVIKLGLSTHKDKIFNRNIYDQSKMFTICVSQRDVNVGPLKIRIESINNNKSRFVISVCE